MVVTSGTSNGEWRELISTMIQNHLRYFFKQAILDGKVKNTMIQNHLRYFFKQGILDGKVKKWTVSVYELDYTLHHLLRHARIIKTV